MEGKANMKKSMKKHRKESMKEKQKSVDPKKTQKKEHGTRWTCEGKKVSMGKEGRKYRTRSEYERVGNMREEGSMKAGR